ncbi:DUF3048 domain-containing protein [Saccharopolyspora indica]|uniref:DUF3048 domain-containing protein n=1 Tax=Saccharopolyspora indica TaxID=1229659 RepID=UPI0022EA7084|nr:DUF3048 domain-containing protein [Saccharopolyspora indica]MDA3645542.1 DUF3048 domain-containing protein [Saccharopolyspora indica]
MRRGLLRALYAAALILLVVLGGVACEPPRAESAMPVLAVKIDNVAAARPPVGIGAANLIYVEPVEGGYSRLLAIFAGQLPPRIGPVRSARETDAELLPQFGHPTLAYSGAAPELLPRIAAAPLTDASDANEPGAYSRDSTRPVPHNLFLDPAELPPGADWPLQNRLVTGPVPAGGTPTDHYEVHFPSAAVEFSWSQPDQRWQVSMDGEPYAAADTGRLSPPTVVIQQVRERESAIRDAAGNPSPIAETVGTGAVVLLRDGRAFEGTWSRPAPDAAATYTGPSGEPLPVGPGQVWIVLAP